MITSIDLRLNEKGCIVGLNIQNRLKYREEQVLCLLHISTPNELVLRIRCLLVFPIHAKGDSSSRLQILDYSIDYPL